jgi:hypothetical protein
MQPKEKIQKPNKNIEAMPPRYEANAPSHMLENSYLKKMDKENK